MKRHALTAIMAAGALMVGGGAAHASTPPAPDAIDGVEITPEVQAYLDTLTAEEAADFVATKLPAHTELTTEWQQPVDISAAASLAAATVSGRAVSPMATGCWSQRQNAKSTSALGNTVYTYYHVGGWCANGSTVTSASISDHGGETSTPGWSYDGVINEGSRVVSNQGRSYSQFQFKLRVGPVDAQTPTPCIRVSGTASGTATSNATCGVY